MNGFKRAALAFVASATLLASLPVSSFAQGGVPAPALAPVHVTYGVLLELTPAYAIIETTSGQPKTVRISDHTRYVTYNQRAALQGLLEGDFVAAYRPNALDTTPAYRLVYNTVPFSHRPPLPGNLVRISGTVVDSPLAGIALRTSNGDLKIAKITNHTRFFLNGQLIQRPTRFQIGTPAHVLARREADGSLTALSVSLRII